MTTATRAIVLSATRMTASRSLSLLALVVGFWLVATYFPASMDMVPPTPAPAPVTEAPAVTDKCKPLPEGMLPGAAVIAWDGGAVDFTRDHDAVDLAFDFALGEASPNTRIVGVTLCR